MPIVADSIRKRLKVLRMQLAEAQARNESEAYLAQCRFKIDELEATLKRAETPRDK